MFISDDIFNRVKVNRLWACILLIVCIKTLSISVMNCKLKYIMIIYLASTTSCQKQQQQQMSKLT